MQTIENRNVSEPLVLTLQQREVLDVLKDKETEEYRLSQWYHGALYALNNHHNPDRVAQAAHSLRELIEKLPRVVQGSDVQMGPIDFKGMRRNINNRIFKDKERYPEGWKNKKIDGRLDKTLRKIENYFERNQQPTRNEQMQQAVATIDPMVNSLDSRIREKKRNQLYRLWKNLEGFTHHKSNTDIVEFSNCLKELENTIFDLLAPITAQDQTEIQRILSNPDRSESDVEDMLSLIERRGANFVFFFKQISENADASWLPFLEKKEYFNHPPNVKLIDGSVVFPFWWPIRYLAKISNYAPEEVIEIVSQLPKVNNPLIYDGILEIALQLHGKQSAMLNPKIRESVGIEYQSQTYRYADLLEHWGKENQIADALELSKILIAFAPDPQSVAKQKLRKEDPMSWGTLLHPVPLIDPWDYHEIMLKGIRPLAESEPYKVAYLLINVTSNMFRLRIHQDELDKEQDFSNIWFARLQVPDKDYGNPDEMLIDTLTFACEKVFEKSHDAIADLDKLLRKQQWKIFKRLRQHLYALYPNEQTKPWIRELILEREDYHQLEHSYEFQKMIRSACKYFGEILLTKQERTQIFDAIRNGPPIEDFREWLGEEFTAERYQKRQHYYHRQQLTPFASVLFGEYKTHFQKLEGEADDLISDDNYPPFETKSGLGSKRSPQSLEDLANFTDEELLSYINEWEKEDELHGDDEFVEINIEALANTFETVFKELIILASNRLRFWIENRERIERPIYLRKMIYAMQAHVKEKNLDQLNEWLTFCEWVLTHRDSNSNQEYEHNRQSDESRENSDWYDSRQAVGDFIGVCLEKGTEVPISARGQLAKLLEVLCTQFDSRLDRNLNSIDPLIDALTEAINSTRGRALADLVKFGYWLRRHDSESETPEVTTILEKRFALETEHPLTLPEYAILGRDYPWIVHLNEAWAVKHKPDFFPREALSVWLAAFGSLVKYSEPFTTTFKILQEDFDFALQQLSNFENCNRFGEDPINILGEHLFTYYLWGLYPLKGNRSLLEKYYQQTKNGQGHWGSLFKDTGHRLSKIEKDLDQNLNEKIINFFEWRLEQEEPMELKHFTFWLQAECLDAEWRLNAYSRVLDVCEVEDWGFHFKTLCEMLPNHTAKVVECFFKLTERIKKDNFYIQTEEAKTILKAGRESSDEKVRRYAADARENLLKSGRFVLPDLED